MIRSAGIASLASAGVGNDLLGCVIQCAFVSFKVLIMFFTVGCKRGVLSEYYCRKECGVSGERAYSRKHVISFC